MLILSRKVDQKIVVGKDIEITVIEIRGDQIRLGISAPKAIPVHREEILRQIEAENRLAARSKEVSLGALWKKR